MRLECCSVREYFPSPAGSPMRERPAAPILRAACCVHSLFHPAVRRCTVAHDGYRQSRHRLEQRWEGRGGHPGHPGRVLARASLRVSLARCYAVVEARRSLDCRFTMQQSRSPHHVHYLHVSYRSTYGLSIGYFRILIVSKSCTARLKCQGKMKSSTPVERNFLQLGPGPFLGSGGTIDCKDTYSRLFLFVRVFSC